MKIIIREPDALRGKEKNGQPKAREYVFDSDIASNCEEIHVSFSELGMIVTNVKTKESDPCCVHCGAQKKWLCVNGNCGGK